MRKLTTFQAAQAALLLAIVAFAVMFIGYPGSTQAFRDLVTCPIRSVILLDADCGTRRTGDDPIRK